MNPPRNYHDSIVELTIERRSLAVEGNEVKLTEKEFALLAYLVANEGQTLPRTSLLRYIWGYDSPPETRTLDVHIRRVRRKLGLRAAGQIETVFAVGYRYRGAPAARPAESLQAIALSA
jgi:DNA-binding response OmpR family regulator